MRRFAAPFLVAALVVGLLPLQAVGQAAAQTVPPTPSRDKWFAQNDLGASHWGNDDGTGDYVRIDASCLDLPTEQEQVDCSLEIFKAKPFPVIAFVDSGINPYHQDFRAPEFTHHPSAYIEGYPAEAEPVELSFDVADTEGYRAAKDADDDALMSLASNRLYWFPGTRIIGGYSTGSGGSSAGNPERRITDENGHGTGVASVAAGRYFGSNPNALIVAVEGLGTNSLRWANSQPWIDIVSNSWGNIGNLPLITATLRDTRVATERGQVVAFAAGNGASNTNSSTLFNPLPVDDACKCKTPDSNPSITGYGGPGWILTVGAASPINGQAHWWHSIPNDVSSFGSKWRAAAVFGVQPGESRDFGGTSCATPVTAGVLSAVIEQARTTFNDTAQGQRSGKPGVVAELRDGGTAPASGPLADGALTRAELEAIVTKTAFPVAADPEKLTWDYAVRPTTPAFALYQGYGVVTAESKARALRVLLGEEALPNRTDAEPYMTQQKAVRDAMWRPAS